MNRILKFKHMLAAAFMLWGANCCPGQSTLPAATQTTTEFVQRMRRFYQLNAINPTDANDAQKTAAGRISEAIKQEIDSHPEMGDYLGYYLARGDAVAGSLPPAIDLAKKVAKNRDDPNCADARMLLHELGYLSNGDPISEDLEARVKTTFDDIMEVYPAGFHSDMAMSFYPVFMHDQFRISMLRADVDWQQSGIPRAASYLPLMSAGDEFAAMNLYDQAIETYRTAVSLMPEDKWISSGDSAKIWMTAGDCFATTGNWKLAISYYYKSMASGQSLADISPRLDKVKAANISNQTATPQKPKPEAAKLEAIATILANAGFYDNALEAVEIANKIPGAKESDLLASLHQRKAEMLEKAMTFFGEGVTIRGQKATPETVKLEKSLARK